MTKKIWAFFFLILILWPSWRIGLVFAWYKVNQNYIAQELCMNRGKPFLNCDGKCVLIKQINTLDQHGYDNFLDGLDDLMGKDLVYFFNSLQISCLKNIPQFQLQQEFPFTFPVSNSFITGLLKPPCLPS